MLGLIVNSGSTSLKIRLIETESLTTVFQAKAEHLNSSSAKLTVTRNSVETKSQIDYPCDHLTAFNMIAESITSLGIEQIDFIGHRIVHGGTYFSKPTLINEDVLKKLSKCKPLAPEHNPIGIKGIKICTKLFKDIPQIAVFDTAFHQTIPEENFRYALPYSFYQAGIRKYGFHGINCSHIVRTLEERFGSGKKPTIILHMGGGTSVTAVKNGKSQYNSMGLTPLEGCIMETRSGSIDPSILNFMNKTQNLGFDDGLRMLNKSSGINCLTTKENMLEILAGVSAGDKDCILGLNMYCDSVASYLLTAISTGLRQKPEQLVFSGGIGENSDIIREKILERLFPFYKDEILLDFTANFDNKELISKPDSQIKVFVIHSNEELEIAIEVSTIINK